MITLEQVEKLKNYGNVSYEDAKIALEATEGDLLEAVIYLEKLGKIKKPENGGEYSTYKEADNEYIKSVKEEKYSNSSSNSQGDNKGIFDTIREWINKSFTNYFEVRRHGKVIISFPVIVLILGLIISFWVTLPLMVIGLFFGCSYNFRGLECKVEDENPLNKAMGVAKDTADQIKATFNDY